MKSTPAACLFFDVLCRAGEERGGLQNELRGEMSLSARSLVALMSANEVRPLRASWGSSTRRGCAEVEMQTRACACVHVRGWCGRVDDGSDSEAVEQSGSISDKTRETYHGLVLGNCSPAQQACEFRRRSEKH